MARRVAITRKVSLADIADDWEDCYAIVTLADFQETKNASETDFRSMKNMDVVAYEIEAIKKHFVSGKINVLDEQGTAQLVDMEPDDIQSSPKLADLLFSVIMGVTLDPKVMKTEVPSSPESTTDLNSTKTTSSTE